MPPKRSSNRRGLIFSTGTAIFITGFLLATGMCIYENNDDMAIIRLLSGQQGITATPDAVFMSLPLSSLLYLLYKLSPALPWYGLTMYVSLTVGCTIGLHVITTSTAETRNKIICLLVFLGFYIAIATRLNFASVSLFLWFCVCTRIAQVSLAEQSYSTKDWLFGYLLGFSYLIRPDIIQTVALLFSLPVVVVLWLFPCKKRLVAILVPFAFMVIIAVAWAQALRSTPEYTDFKEFNKVRGLFTDTTLANLNRQSTEALSATGWNIFDHHLAKQYWWLHDGTLFSASKLDTFMKNNKGSESSLLNYHAGLTALQSQKTNLSIALLCIAALLIVRRPHTDLITSEQRYIQYALAVTLLMVPLLAMVRFPSRVAMPVFVCLVLFAVVFRPFYGCINGVRSILVSYFFWILFCASVATLITYNCRYAANELYAFKAIKTYCDQSIHEVQQRTGTNTLFLSASLANAAFGADYVSPLLEYRALTPLLNIPSGWHISAPWYNVFIQTHGLIDREHLIPQLVNNHKVVLGFWDTTRQTYAEFSGLLIDHLQRHYGSQFPGTKFTLNTVLDKRSSINTELGSGLIFFSIQAAPTGINSKVAP